MAKNYQRAGMSDELALMKIQDFVPLIGGFLKLPAFIASHCGEVVS